MTDNTLIEKHASKRYKGFLKQRMRQLNKPSEVKIMLETAITLPENFKGVYKHFLKVENSKWNGMNLMNITNSLYPIKRYNGMNTKFYKGEDGKVKLSRYGKQILNKKRALKGKTYEND